MADFGGFDSYVDKTRTAGRKGGQLGGQLDGLGLNYGGLFGGLTKNTEARGNEMRMAAEGLFRARAGGIRQQYASTSAQTEDRLASQGIDPLFAQGAIEENRAGASSQIEQAQGESQAQLHQGLSGLLGEDFESRGSLSLAQRQAKLSYYFGRLQYHMARKGQSLGVLSDVFGTAAGAASAVGGTGGGAEATTQP